MWPLDELIRQPGANGVGAVIAAVIVLISAVIVSVQRRTEHTRNLALETAKAAADERDKQIARWWARFTWLVEVDALKLSAFARVAILQSLRTDAEALNEPTLLEAVHGYQRSLDSWVLEIIESREQPPGDRSQDR